MSKAEKPKNKQSFGQLIGDKANRKMAAQRDRKSALSGLGLFGLIGWSVTVPALLGILLGVWLDKHVKQNFSWTLSLLLAGLMFGCFIAWNWLQKENQDIHKKSEDEHE